MAQATRSNGPRIRELREAKDMTVEEFTEALAREGVRRHPGTIRQAETGSTNLGFKAIHAAARVLGVTFDELVLKPDTEPARAGTGVS